MNDGGLGVIQRFIFNYIYQTPTIVQSRGFLNVLKLGVLFSKKKATFLEKDPGNLLSKC